MINLSAKFSLLSWHFCIAKEREKEGERVMEERQRRARKMCAECKYWTTLSVAQRAKRVEGKCGGVCLSQAR